MIHLDETQVGQHGLLMSNIDRLETLKQLDLIEKLKPTFSKDGNMFCYLYGENLQEGIAGFGETVAIAMNDFYKNFYSN